MNKVEEIRKQYNTIVVYGCGEYYHRHFADIRKIAPNYICDRKFTHETIERDGIKIVLPENIKKLDNPIIVITIEKNWLLQELKNELSSQNLPYIQADELLGIPFSKVITGKDLLSGSTDVWSDNSGNEIHFDESISDKITISIAGRNNTISIGKNVSVRDRFLIRCGSNSVFSVGDDTEMLSVEAFLSDSSIKIGNDCLFSREIELRCHDNHQIFSLKSGKRINFANDIEICDQVWISEYVVLLGGAKIGTGSVVGTGCITSGAFDDHTVIVGVPGKVIHSGIIWSKDNIEYISHDYFNECVDQNALKYL